MRCSICVGNGEVLRLTQVGDHDFIIQIQHILGSSDSKHFCDCVHGYLTGMKTLSVPIGSVGCCGVRVSNTSVTMFMAISLSVRPLSSMPSPIDCVGCEECMYVVVNCFEMLVCRVPWG